VLFDRDNDIDECGLDVCFASNFEVLGKLTQHELKPGGAQILVTDANKEEYLKYTLGLLTINLNLIVNF